MSRPGFIDFHNHVIPGVDDGAATDDECIAALQAFREAGVVHVVATPHVQGSLTLDGGRIDARLAEIDRGWERLVALAGQHASDLRIARGAEVMLDMPQPDLSDARLRLAGGPYALVEYPFMSVPPNSIAVLDTLARDDVRPIIAHPERYAGIDPESDLPREWKHAGALLQVNAGSITGRYGQQAQRNAFALLERGLADFVCSDFHARGRPSTNGALHRLEEIGGVEHADLLMSVNPRRMLAGEETIPVPPLRRPRGVWQRITGWLR